MKLLKPGISIIAFLVLIFSCQKETTTLTGTSPNTQTVFSGQSVSTITETFETGTKAAYADATVTLSTGVWDFNDALLGNTSSDRKIGTQSVRMRNSGILTTDFDYTSGASTVSIYHALYGSDASSTWQLWYSTNGGSTYTQTGGTITTSSTTLVLQSFTINVAGNIRFQVRKTDGTSNRINFDNFAVTAYGGVVSGPTLTSISPDSANSGGAAFTITATGTNFVSGSTINWNGTALTTTYVSATQLTASVPKADISAVGTDSVQVATSGAGNSASLPFYVKKAVTGSIPTLTSVSPTTATAGGASFTLTATGTKFVSGATINWNGTALTTTYVSAKKLTATVPAADIASAGTESITVSNTGGGTSAAVSFSVTGGVSNNPTLTTISPSSVTAGAAAFTLTATGTNYTSSSTINWNGTALTTTYVSTTSLTASVPATDVATAGTASVTVATSGVGTSSALTFTIKPVTTGQKRFLFDATHAETAGNADWVIDEDNNNPQRVPTPAQSTVTASTPETYWTGAISSFGIALVKAGDFVETLPTTGGTITYGNSSNAQDLSNYDVFVVDEPNTVFTAAEKVAILSFVKNGGGLFMVSDHTGSDRNNDGWDSPRYLERFNDQQYSAE